MRRRFPIHSAFIDIKNSISWYQEMYSEAPFYYLLSISWYQEFDFLISRIHFLISRNIILDIKKYKSWYQEMKFISWYKKINSLISKNIFWGAVLLFF